MIFQDEGCRRIYLGTTLGLFDDALESMVCGWMKNEEQEFESKRQRVAKFGSENEG